MQNAWETQQHRKKAPPWDQKERRQKAIELVTPDPATGCSKEWGFVRHCQADAGRKWRRRVSGCRWRRLLKNKNQPRWKIHRAGESQAREGSSWSCHERRRGACLSENGLAWALVGTREWGERTAGGRQRKQDSGEGASFSPQPRIEGSQGDLRKEDQEGITENLISEEMQWRNQRGSSWNV